MLWGIEGPTPSFFLINNGGLAWGKDVYEKDKNLVVSR